MDISSCTNTGEQSHTCNTGLLLTVAISNTSLETVYFSFRKKKLFLDKTSFCFLIIYQ